jgi:hypothetical protein
MNIFQYKAPKNLPKLGFSVRKETIWHPCSTLLRAFRCSSYAEYRRSCSAQRHSTPTYWRSSELTSSRPMSREPSPVPAWSRPATAQAGRCLTGFNLFFSHQKATFLKCRICRKIWPKQKRHQSQLMHNFKFYFVRSAPI